MTDAPTRTAVRRALLAVTAAAIAVLALGCSKGSDANKSAGATGPSTGMLLRGNGPGPESLDPQRARAFESHQVLRDLYEGLTVLGRDGAPVAGSATEWAVSADGRTYTFKLRPELRWSNGDPLVAADFVAGMRRLVDPKTASQYAQVVDVIVNAADIIAGKKPPESLGVSAPDAATVVVKLTSPAPYLPALLTHPSCAPIHQPSLATEGAQFTRPGKMVSNGAFVLSDLLQGTHITLQRNPNYHDNAANKIDAVRYFTIPDENAELRAYRAGELHITSVVPRGQFDWIKQNLAAELHVSPQLNTYYYGFNLERAPFKDNPKLRRALSMAIDRERLASAVLRVGELPAYSWVPPGVPNYSAQTFDYAKMPHTERVALAQRLYADAGYSAAKPLTFELRYNSGEVHNKLAVAIAGMWKEALGVKVELVAAEFKSLLEDVDRRDVDMFRLSWVGDYNDPYTFLQLLKSDFGINKTRYKSTDYDRLLTDAAATTDLEARRSKLEAAERIMLADHPLLPIYFYVNKHLVKPGVRGWYDNAMNVVYSKDLELAAAAAR
jgi:oligopeptide transport system substrate-binding protein